MIENSQKQRNTCTHFFRNHPVFSLSEFHTFLDSHHSRNPHTRKALLQYYTRGGKIISIRRNLYAAVPEESSASTFRVDPIHIAARITPDAVISHHSALEVLGKAYSVYSRITYESAAQTASFQFQGCSFVRTSFPAQILNQFDRSLGIDSIDYHGMEIRVTGYERTCVDALHRPDLTGTWEEIWKSLESIEFFDLELVWSYVSQLGNATTYAKTGFFLEQHSEQFMVDEATLALFERHRPKAPHYLDRKTREKSRFIKRWNLMVPIEILDRTWEERI